MKKKFYFILLLILLFTLTTSVFSIAYADIPDGLSLSGDAAVLIDADTGEIIFAHNENETMPVASVQKIMTLYIIFNEIEEGRLFLDDVVCVSHNSAAMGGSQVYLEEGGQYTVNNLLKSIIVASANDSCVALGEHISGSEEGFVAKMNETAKKLGLTSTLYVNCTGLPAENHHMSAIDIAKVSRELIKNDLFFTYSTIWTNNFIHPSGRTTLITNTNKLTQSYTGCDGIKTGFTNEAMYCLSSTAKRGDTRLIAIVLGEPTSKIRNNDISSMFNYGFANYSTYKIFSKGDIIKEDIPVLGGKSPNVDATVDENVSAFIKKELQNSITSTVTVFDGITAPLLKGDVIGEVKIFSDGKLIRKQPIIANRNVEAVNFFDCIKKIMGFFSTKNT